MAASTTEMLMNSDGLVVNAYHNAEGRGNYFPGSAGTSEGQFLFIIGNLHAYQVTGNPIAREMAENALKSLLRVVYRNTPVPEKVTPLNIFAPHWLFNVKYPFDSSVIHYDRPAQFVNGVGYLTVDASRIRYVYGARTMDSILLWDNPYSPLTQGTAYAVASSEFVAGMGMKVTLTQPFSGQLYVTHSTQTGPAIQVNEPFEAWPDWRKLEPGEIACAADVFVWAHRAFTRASQVLSNPIWAAAARATREQAVIAFDINDSRDWIKPSWAKSPFAIGSRFAHSTRVPGPGYSVNENGEVVITVPTYGAGGAEVQYGNASVLDVYGANDVTHVEIGSSQPLDVTVFIDPEQNYDPQKRYQCRLRLNGTGVQSFPLNRGNFVTGGDWSGYTTAIEIPGRTSYAIGNYKVAGQPENSLKNIGTGAAKNIHGHTVMARIYWVRGGYYGQVFDVAVVNGDTIGGGSDSSNVAAWMAQWTTVQLLRADGSVLMGMPLAQMLAADVSNGKTYTVLFDKAEPFNAQINEWLANYALVKFVRFSNANTSQVIQTYGFPMPVNSPVYTFGVSTNEVTAHTLTIRRVRQTPPRNVMYYPGAIPFTANFQGNPAQLIDWRGPIYTGYQSPSMWLTIGNPVAAETNMQLLSDAQQEWRSQTGQGTLGPFAPVFIFDRPDAVQYGAPNTFTWDGPDPNTRWGGYQYRPLAELTDAALQLPAGALRDKAIGIAQNFIKWLAQDWAWLPSWAPWVDAFSHMIEHVAAVQIPNYSLAHVDEWTLIVNKTAAGEITKADAERPVLSAKNRYSSPRYTDPLDFPKRPPLGPPTDYPKGAAEINYPEPHMAALVLRSVIELDKVLRPQGNQTGPMQIEHRAVISKCMGLFDAMWIEDGIMGGTFSSNPAAHEWYGFWHGEILDTLAQLYDWASSTNVARPSIAEQAKYWIDGMLRWSKAAVMPSEVGYQVVPWSYTPNWIAGMEETFEFSTQIFTSFSGKEQRLSRRVAPRRRLSMRHSLVGNEARGMEALLRARQNLPLTVPQWHLAIQLAADAPGGQSFVILDSTDTSAFQWNRPVMISHSGGLVTMMEVLSTHGNRLDFTTSLTAPMRIGDKVMPAAHSLIDQSMSATRHTGTVLDSLASFIVLPQYDPYELPRLAPNPDNTFLVTSNGAPDLREVIRFEPNWVKEPVTTNDWDFNTSERFIAGPVVPVNGRDQGTRTVQALWTLKSKVEINEFKALVRRLQGRRYAAWLPSWTDDLELTRAVIEGDRIHIRYSPLIDLGTLLDPAVGIHLRLRSGLGLQARAVSVAEVAVNEYEVVVDRPFPRIQAAQVGMASLMYRVRQVSDSITLKYLTDSVAEVSAAFVSVYDEAE